MLLHGCTMTGQDLPQEDLTPYLIDWLSQGVSIEYLVQEEWINPTEADLLNNMFHQLDTQGEITQSLYDSLQRINIDFDRLYFELYEVENPVAEVLSDYPVANRTVPKWQIIALPIITIGVLAGVVYFATRNGSASEVQTPIPISCAPLEELEITNGAMTMQDVRAYLNHLPDPYGQETLQEKVLKIIDKTIMPSLIQENLAKPEYQSALADGTPQTELEEQIRSSLLGVQLSEYLDSVWINEELCNLNFAPAAILLPLLKTASKYSRIMHYLWDEAVVQPAYEIAQEYKNMVKAPLRLAKRLI